EQASQSALLSSSTVQNLRGLSLQVVSPLIEQLHTRREPFGQGHRPAKPQALSAAQAGSCGRRLAARKVSRCLVNHPAQCRKAPRKLRPDARGIKSQAGHNVDGTLQGELPCLNPRKSPYHPSEHAPAPEPA